MHLMHFFLSQNGIGEPSGRMGMHTQKVYCDTETTRKENKICYDHCLFYPLPAPLKLYN